MIYVFKTSVTNTKEKEIEILKPHLDTHLESAKWNFDLDDCDNILRIDSANEIAETTIKLLKNKGYNCVELQD